jgi:hypothetical protein
MNFRGWLILLLLLATGLAGYWLYANVPLYALAVNNGDEWSLVASGWNAFYQGWFFVVPGIVVACLILLPLISWTYGQAEDADHLRALEQQKRDYELKMSGLRERLALAEKRAENALNDAKQKYDAAIAKAEKNAMQAQSDIEKGKSMQAQALEFAKQSKKDAEKASQEATRATKKKNNAMAAAERIKRREARLREN